MYPKRYHEALTYIKTRSRSILALLGACSVGLVLIMVPISSHYVEAPGIRQVVSSTTPLEIVGPTLTKAAPETIRIPRLDLQATFSTVLGLTEFNEIEVPRDYETVGWYGYGPTPGELGPAVVLGHVDSVRGPAVFFSLGQLEVGDEILIDRADGTTATFIVTELERPRQNAFPTARVYGDIDHAGLRLITCSGTFVRGQQRYTHNLIVYARLIES